MSRDEPFEKGISEGDRVRVNINTGQMTLCHEARVEHVPCATGDSWIFEDLRTGQIHYVSEGCTVTLLEKADPIF